MLYNLHRFSIVEDVKFTQCELLYVRPLLTQLTAVFFLFYNSGEVVALSDTGVIYLPAVPTYLDLT